MRVFFQQGEGTAVVDVGGFALVATPPSSPVVSVLMQVVSTPRPDIASAIDGLSALGLSTLPPFGLVVYEDGGFRLLIRNGVSATIGEDDARLHLDARTVATWLEQTAEAGPITLDLGVSTATDLAYEVRVGTVPASVVWAGGERPSEMNELVVRRESLPVELAEPSMPTIESPAEATIIALDDELEPIAPSPSPPLVDAAERPVVAEEPALPTGADEFDFQHLIEHTVFRSIADAEVRSNEDDDSLGTSASPSTAPLSPVPPPPGEIPQRREPGASSAQSAATKLIDSVPSEVPSSPASGSRESPGVPTPAAPQVDIDDNDHTVARPSAIATSHAPLSGPTVQAVRCSSGHPNPPLAEHCRVCRGPIIDRKVLAVGRPSLGCLRFGNGRVIILDRPYLLGRKPTAAGLVNNEVPGIAALDDPEQELSRTHAEIRLEDWQVLVVDRDSLNHTFVQLPGQEQRRLYPNDPVPIVPGTRIDLGGSVSCTYEVRDL
jgi:hypothetical protein